MLTSTDNDILLFGRKWRNTIKKVLGIMLALVIFLSACEKTKKEDTTNSTTGATTTVSNSNFYEKEEGYIYFGTYPQTEVSDETKIATLTSYLQQNNIGMPTDSTNLWNDYGYYADGSNTTGYMWYVDVNIGADKYRGVYFTSYRPDSVSDENIADNSRQDENGYNLSTVYWFLFEPIKWQILEETEEKATLLCDLALDNQVYQAEYKGEEPYYNNSADTPVGIYANNWEYSAIRKWLATNFVDTAFTASEKNIISKELIDNRTTSIGSPKNLCALIQENTYDTVYLPSYLDLTLSDYGYSKNDSDVKRAKIATDYAKIQGIYINNGGVGDYYSRSAGATSSLSGLVVCESDGFFAGDGDVSGTCGIVPMLVIKL